MLNFNPALLAPYFSYREVAPLALTATDRVVFRANPNRVLVAFGNQGGTYYVRPNAIAAVNSGFSVGVNVNTVFNFADWGTIVCAEWHAIGNGIQSGYAMEVIYNPPGD